MSEGHNHPAVELKRRAERRRVILDQIDDLQVDLKALKTEDKEDGFNEKALAQCIKELRRGADYQCDQLTLELELDTYRKAVGLPVTLEAAQEAALKEAQIVPAVDDRTTDAYDALGSDEDYDRIGKAYGMPKEVIATAKSKRRH